MSSHKVLPLQCAVQQYAWGKLGSNSQVACLAAAGDENLKVDEGAPYAELWMGTHPKGPSRLINTSEMLSDWLAKNPASVGDKVRQRFPQQGQLPFLFKVLSVSKALSIQAHPNKTHAEKLHAERPDKYPDPNHKPEMCIALTKFEGMCGFRPKEEILSYLKKVPELQAVIGTSLVEELESSGSEESFKASLQKCFHALMSCDPETVQSQLAGLVQRLNSSAQVDGIGDEAQELLLRLNSQFPGDVGCFCSFLLNHMWLEPGDAMFLEANLPHAYLSGDCIECMACSDNVVRAGLTPKFKDVPTLCSMLNYSCKEPKENLFQWKPHATDSLVRVYNPPVPDFAVDRLEVPAGTRDHSLDCVDSASIILVIEGKAKVSNPSLEQHAVKIQPGTVLFVSANEKIDFSLQSDSRLLLFRAYCQL